MSLSPPETNRDPNPTRAQWLAHVLPFITFIILLAVLAPLKAGAAAAGFQPFWLSRPEYWLYPLQTLICAALLIYFRARYEFSPRWAGMWIGAGAGAVAFVIWIAPVAFLHFPPRTQGFDPTLLAARAAAYYPVLGFRLLRLAVVVPFLEEVFWRGFLLRYLVREDSNFTRLRYVFTPWSFGMVTLLFMLEHNQPDWPAALAVGALYNWIAIRTQSLGACVLAHAVTNAALGTYVLGTGQWGYW